jgi:hypothetical protein
VTHLDDHVITREAGPPWAEAPEWVNWWAAESWGGSWFWQEEPVLVDSEDGFGQYWLAPSGYTPMFAGHVNYGGGTWWKESKLKRPSDSDGILGDPPEVADAESR